ncbi:hypothetical protein [Sphingobium nicotianae]|uniref:Uncharacterized protein n=1 Tax=Sphingobium nicotianae TaxID=2782607 RepID=A0A9X1DF30_9SPHN|nr:hypothetical protein [Sphingobium nicotianae]MBT2188737.1 hypothetical protein [Sphingobium nicotianae]
MTLVFDAANARFDQYVLLLIPAAALLVTLFNAMRGRRKWALIMGGVTTLLFLIAFVLPVADYRHVRAALTDGSAKTIEGVISQHKRETTKSWTGSSRAAGGVSSFSSYTTHTSEQFFVGRTWFWLCVGGFPSGASFTNAKDPPLPLRDGMRVRVTYFNDPWNGEETRILKFEIDESPAGAKAPPVAAAVAPTGASASLPAGSTLPADFDAFWTRFSRAAAGGDRAGVKALIRFPFLFAGTPLDAGRFDSIWMGIFPEPIRPCFRTAVPVRDGDAWSVSCGAYVYVFAKGATGWQFTDFAADPEG